MKKVIFIILLFLVLLLALPILAVKFYPAYFLRKVPGLELEEARVSFFPLGVEAKNIAYDGYGVEFKTERLFINSVIRSFRGLRKQDPEALFLDLYASNSFFRVSGEDEEEAEEKRNWEELIRVPFYFVARIDDLRVELGEDLPEIGVSGRLANSYEGGSYSITGAFQTVEGKAALDIAGGVSGDVLFLNCKGGVDRKFLPFLGFKSEAVVIDDTSFSIDLSSRLDWEKLRDAYASEIPEAITDIRSEVRGRAKNLEALYGKIAINNLTLRADLKTEKFLRERKDYSTTAAWLFHAFKGGFDCSCGAMTMKDMAPHAIEFGPCKAQTYLKNSGLVLSNLFLNTMLGQMSGWAEISSRKVKGKDDYLPYLEFDLKTSGLDVGIFCDLFNFKENRMDGQLKGEFHTALFGKYVKALNGKLYSTEKGIFTLGQAETYLKGMEEGYSKDVVNILASRLKKYPYKDASVELNYENKVTKVTFVLEGANDNSHIKLPVSIHSTWVDLLDLAKQFK